MGLLTKISEREATLTKKIFPAPATPKPIAESAARPSDPCPACGGKKFWLDSYRQWNCETCRPAKAAVFIRDRFEVVPRDPDGFEVWEDLRATFGPVFDGWREFLRADGIRGIVQAGNERGGMSLIDCFEYPAQVPLARQANRT